jgi:hypothetical protein
MFTRLLEEARSEPAKVVHVARSPPRQSGAKNIADDKVRLIVHELSEFLFDIFDANCLPAFKAIEALEHQYCRHFAAWEKGEELSHVMHDAWSRFTALFEKLIEAFLRDHGWSNEECYRAAERALKDKALIPPQVEAHDPWQQNPNDQATEILEVLMAVQDIHVWAGQMKELHNRLHRLGPRATAGATAAGSEQKIEFAQIQKK